MWTDLLIYRICWPEQEKSSCLDHWPLQFVLNLLLGERLDAATYGPDGGKLHLLCQGW